MHTISLPIIWSYDRVRITEDARVWFVDKGKIRRMVWKIHERLPSVQIYSQWRSARWLEKKRAALAPEAPGTHFEPQRLVISQAMNGEPVAHDIPALNQMVVECIQSGYFLKSIQHGQHINWDLFAPPKTKREPVKEYRPMIRPSYPNLRDKIFDFIFNPNPQNP